MKVAIIGCAPSRENCPYYNNPDWEIWFQATPNLPNWNRCFEIHSTDKFTDPNASDAWKGLWKWLTGTKPSDAYSALPDGEKPVYMRKAHDNIKGSRPYPFDMIVEKFGGPLVKRFLTSCVAYEMALAISEMIEAGPGEHEIALYGVEMAADGEWSEQKPGCQFWMLIAGYHGIKVSVPPGCELMSPCKAYELENDDFLEMKVIKKLQDLKVINDQIDAAMEMAQKQLRTCQDQKNQIAAGIALMEDIQNNWVAK